MDFFETVTAFAFVEKRVGVGSGVVAGRVVFVAGSEIYRY